ncbi:sarcalumenin-like [Antedon mediterranea]|uniref:sarcalumenin-like n=1 Tax=Antedon mediterranea TaxID=105859 RepID=UPI003AF6D173
MTTTVSFVVWLALLLAYSGMCQSEQKQNMLLTSLTKKDTMQKDLEEAVMRKLKEIYREDIKPIEDLYHYHNYVLSDSEIDADPMVLVLGPWSAGKSTLINYILELDDEIPHLATGSEPTTSEFTIVMHGKLPKKVDGTALVTDYQKPYSSLATFGTGFLQRLIGLEMPNEILKKVTFVDTPGIIENRRQQERGYPFNDVMHWFIDRADLIFVVFDPSKLDVGIELESIFHRLKGHESKIKIIMNKADSMDTKELMRVYGALFWNLSPLINVTEPPRVYVGSFWSQKFKNIAFQELFKREEQSLGEDLHTIVSNNVQSKISMIRQRAISARIHALTVQAYKQTYDQQSSLMYSNEKKMADIIKHPGKYGVFQRVLGNANVSAFDLASPQSFQHFFTLHQLDSFQLLQAHCSIFTGCPLEMIETAIFSKLPDLLKKFNIRKSSSVHKKIEL